MQMCSIIYYTDKNSAAVDSAVRTEDVSYGQIAITPKRTRGMATFKLWIERSYSGCGQTLWATPLNFSIQVCFQF